MPLFFPRDLDLAMKVGPSGALTVIAVLALGLAGCQSLAPAPDLTDSFGGVAEQASPPTAQPANAAPIPGEMVDYSAQTGDTLVAVASHFNTTVDEILAVNPDIPAEVSTLPPGYPLRIPAYFLPLTTSSFRILPDSEVVNGPSAVAFDLRLEVMRRPGFLAGVTDYAYGRERPGWEVVEVVARNYSLHPRLLLALLEFRSGALTNPFPRAADRAYPLGYRNELHRGLYRQLLWAAERLNDGYYGWRIGELKEFETADGLLARPDPWQNAGTVAVQYLMAGLFDLDSFEMAVSEGGFNETYRGLWGDPFEYELMHIPADLQQPELALPFLPNRIWDFSGGPHPTWGDSLPWGALDFAPPAMEGGCAFSSEWIASPADGFITRSGSATIVLDLDGDRDERTGWILMFFHVGKEDRIPAGTEVSLGDPLGHPSCEGGRSTGTHFHVARRYNGEWLPAGGPLPFVLDGWVADSGSNAYEGTLRKGSRVIEACTCSTRENRVVYELPSSEP